METLVAKNFRLKGIFEMDHEHCHAYEWNLKENEINLLKRIVEIMDINLEEDKNRIIDILNGNYIPVLDESLSAQIVDKFKWNFIPSFTKYFSLQDNEQQFETKFIIYEASKLVCSNSIEFVRIENDGLIISEIKSQYGSDSNYGIELSHRQVETYTKLTNKGIRNSLIYCIALPEPRFIEIPFSDFYNQFRKYNDFNGKEFTTTDWSCIRVRIPYKYRDISKYNCIEKSLYNYNGDKSLFKAILNEYQYFNDRLGNLI